MSERVEQVKFTAEIRTNKRNGRIEGDSLDAVIREVAALEIVETPRLAADLRCATCKWAEDVELISPPESHALQCRRISRISSENALAIIDTNNGRYACLFVAPTFGCVQWEGK